jgi:hypothetical protein
MPIYDVTYTFQNDITATETFDRPHQRAVVGTVTSKINDPSGEFVVDGTTYQKTNLIEFKVQQQLVP